MPRVKKLCCYNMYKYSSISKMGCDSYILFLVFSLYFVSSFLFSRLITLPSPRVSNVCVVRALHMKAAPAAATFFFFFPGGFFGRGVWTGVF